MKVRENFSLYGKSGIIVDKKADVNFVSTSLISGYDTLTKILVQS